MESASAQNEASAAVRLQLSVMAGGVNERRLIEAQLEERRKMAGEKVAEATIKLQVIWTLVCLLKSRERRMAFSSCTSPSPPSLLWFLPAFPSLFLGLGL